ncbi:biotin-dependent carboxyltransferase family protein [Paracoccus sp. Z330]|uniref:Biotin-dependent carboxyltransferase family protein n=1 Tax=Paracoccus onchidii TaxID=3017813 RepID=A0ABT4ZCT7_9RHOB|nr:biotin-dependent carboxyltransferase family protein [Paracoccus onchidii]MDB6177175.1 biotin-dependent carboxyltransferase family protein [Paracoccus onchidii]
MTQLRIERADGLLTIQDCGRPGHLAQGLSRGGAMDRCALFEATALLGLPAPAPAIEMAAAGGSFSVTQPMRVALTGAPMLATLDDAPLRWHATHVIMPGQRLRIGGAQSGIYGYLTPAGGITSPEWLGSRATHLTIGIGSLLQSGQSVPCGPDDAADAAPRVIDPLPRFNGGTVRIAKGAQTDLFGADTLERFLGTDFIRAARGNRQGVQLDAQDRFSTEHAAGLASDVIGPGDVQMTGDGIPYVLMAECQTIGGYPRIGCVIPADLPIIAQAAPGTTLRFQMLSTTQSDDIYRSDASLIADAAARCRNLIRDPSTIPDLLSYQLIGGVTAGTELEESQCA